MSDAYHPTVCWRDHFGSEGSAKEYLVRLPDGFLLSCGIDGYSELRAQQVARMLAGFPDLELQRRRELGLARDGEDDAHG